MQIRHESFLSVNLQEKNVPPSRFATELVDSLDRLLRVTDKYVIQIQNQVMVP